MKKTVPALLTALLAAPIAPAIATDSLHIAHSVFQAEKNNQKHPALLTHTISINQDVAVPRLCVAYANTASRNKGWSVANIQIIRADGTEESARLAEQVRKFSFVKCTKAEQLVDLAAGDTLIFEYDFQNMKRLKRKGEQTDRVEVNSVVVADGFPLPLGTVGAVPGEEEAGKKGGWFHSSNFNFQAAKNNQKHHASFSKMVVIQHDVAAPNVCSLYRNTLKKKGKGKVTTAVSISRDEEVIESFTYKSSVKKNKARKCNVAQDLLAGDIVAYDFIFEGFPRLKKTSSKTDYAETTGVVASNGIPEFASIPSDPSDPSPGPGDPSPPPPSGGFTSADLAAAAKILYGSRPAQLWRFKNDQPTIWTVIGPATKLGSGPGGIDPSTVGYGNTIAAALADYERKRGKFSAASKSLSSADVSALTWFRNINTSGGPTSIRLPRGASTYVGEFYRPGKGVNHQTFGSFVAAINYLKSQGL
jgi:hypothetical protein